MDAGYKIARLCALNVVAVCQTVVWKTVACETGARKTVIFKTVGWA